MFTGRWLQLAINRGNRENRNSTILEIERKLKHKELTADPRIQR